MTWWDISMSPSDHGHLSHSPPTYSSCVLLSCGPPALALQPRVRGTCAQGLGLGLAAFFLAAPTTGFLNRPSEAGGPRGGGSESWAHALPQGGSPL